MLVKMNCENAGGGGDITSWELVETKYGSSGVTITLPKQYKGLFIKTYRGQSGSNLEPVFTSNGTSTNLTEVSSSYGAPSGAPDMALMGFIKYPSSTNYEIRGWVLGQVNANDSVTENGASVTLTVFGFN